MIRAARMLAVGDRSSLGGGPSASEALHADGERIILDDNGRPTAPLARSGLYEIMDRADQSLGSVAVNVDPAAGRTDTQSVAAVSAWLGAAGRWEVFEADDPGAALKSATSGLPIAGIILAILVGIILLETILARRFSHAFTGGPDKARGLELRATMSEVRGKAAMTARGGGGA